MGVTHIVNVAFGKKNNQTFVDPATYEDNHIAFHGICALDNLTYKILPELGPAAAFIHRAVLDKG